MALKDFQKDETSDRADTSNNDQRLVGEQPSACSERQPGVRKSDAVLIDSDTHILLFLTYLKKFSCSSVRVHV